MAKDKAAPAGAPAWMVTFADLMSLLVCFFVLIISFSIQDEQKLQVVAGSIRDAFGVRRDWQARALMEIDGRPKTRKVDLPPHNNIVVYMPRPDRAPPEDATQDDKAIDPNEASGKEAQVREDERLMASAADFLEVSDYSGDSLHARIGDPGADGGDGAAGAIGAAPDWREQFRQEDAPPPEPRDQADRAEKSGPDDPADAAAKPENDKSPEQAKRAMAAAKAAAVETKMVEDLKQRIEQLVAARPELAEVAKNLTIERAEEGVRIQLVDNFDLPMFSLGSADLADRVKPIVAEVARLVAAADNRVLITGHTDGRPYRGRTGYDNWNLSSDRAHATRRALIAAGVPARKIAGVLGKGDSEHAIATDPNDPRNRRIGILLLRKDA